MFTFYIVMVAVSLLFMAGAAFLAVRLIRTTGASRAWLAIAAALATMVVRRIVLLVSRFTI